MLESAIGLHLGSLRPRLRSVNFFSRQGGDPEASRQVKDTLIVCL